VRDALARQALVLVRERTGLVHVTVPLVLDGCPVGALLAGQVFDQYPEQLWLEPVATRVGLAPQALWQLARLEPPIPQATIRVYGRLLAALGQAFLHTRYHTLLEVQRAETLEQRVQEHTAALHHELAARTAAEAQVHQAHTQLRALLARLDVLQEAERTRLARDLHDDLGQQLTGLHMNLAWLAQQLGTMTRSRRVPALLERVGEALALVQTLSASVHDIAVALRPSMLDRLGLGPALHEEARRFQARTAIVTTLHVADPELALAPDLRTALFRMFQECLTNVARHAGATQVEAALTTADGWVTLRVQDNGRGMPEAAMRHPTGLGILGMHERAVLLGGEVQVTRGAGHGTLVTVRLPQQGTPDSTVSMSGTSRDHHGRRPQQEHPEGRALGCEDHG
jgi:signal transduction histidine kinase